MTFVAVIAGARPNFMKVAPLLSAFATHQIPARLIHTGQHYDKNMSDVFFQDLGMEEPYAHLGAGSGTHAEQTADIMVKFEKFCLKERPAWTLVVGDVNSTVACSLVAAKLGIKVCHLEAGLRSRDWTMPEEINRVVTDRLSDLLLTPSSDGDANLLAEGVPADRIRCVGNIMIDSLFQNLEKAKKSQIHQELAISKDNYGLVTLHRPSNVDSESMLRPLVEVLIKISKKLPLVIPLHPRTEKCLQQFELLPLLESAEQIRLAPPLGYIDFMALSSQSKLVITDSGGLQEETTALGIPCLTVRENTERPITISEGTNKLVGTSASAILAAATDILEGKLPEPKRPVFWDGRTAERCAAIFKELL